MAFLWPQMLLWLLAVPLLVAAYVWLLRRKKKQALRYPSVALVKVAIGPGQVFRRHVPPALFLLALIASIIAMARPTAVVTLPSQQQTIIMAMDVSLSMGARDVDPNRITAAQAAAKTFVNDHPPNVQIGIVAFGATASLVQPPTRNREELLDAIDRFQLQRGTATGSALYVALATLFPKRISISSRSCSPVGSRVTWGKARGSTRRAKTRTPPRNSRRCRPALSFGGDHPALRRPQDDGARPTRRCPDGGRPRRQGVHRRLLAPPRAA